MPERTVPPPLKPFWATSDGEAVRLYLGDVLAVLRRLPTTSVHCVVTSPPYWGLRDYQTGTWEGGSPDCDHKVRPKGSGLASSGLGGKPRAGQGHQQETWLSGVCGRCGARRTDQQLGSEPSPDCETKGRAQCGRCFVCAMVGVFREVRRVLRDDGTVWLNLGDTYAGGCGGGNVFSGGRTDGRPTRDGDVKFREGIGDNDPARMGMRELRKKVSSGVAPGNLVGVPWRVALALQADGWVLRQDVIWHKLSPMPEPVRNRCTKAHEYVFLLAKRQGYFYDAEAVKEPAVPGSVRTSEKGGSARQARGGGVAPSGNGVPGTQWSWGNVANKRSVWTADDPAAVLRWMAERYPDVTAECLADAANKGDVWRLSSEAYPGAHFATFPAKLVRPCVRAGTSERGCCAECGAPWRRVVEETKLKRDRPNDHVKRTGAAGTGNSCANTAAGVAARTVGWEPTCACHGRFVPRKVWRRNVVGGKGLTAGAYAPPDPASHGNARDGKNGRWETVYDYVCACGVSWAYERGGVAYTPEVVAPGVRNVDASRGDKTRKLSGADYNKANAVPTAEREDPCDCYRDKVRPCLVLDPFVGSGTTNVVCLLEGRRSWGIDLSEDYLRGHAARRVKRLLMETPRLTRLLAPGP